MPPPPIPSAHPQAPRPDRMRQLAREAAPYGVALLAVLVFRTMLFQPFTIPSDSMEPGLLRGDYILVSKYSYGWSRSSLPFAPPLFHGRILGGAPRRGDVVVFRRPGEGQGEGKGETIIKRLIGLPGDRIQLVQGVLQVNGVPVARADLGPTTDPDVPTRAVSAIRETLPEGKRYTTLLESPDHLGETTDVYVVPQGRYFFLGDNRDNSLDSRWPQGIGMGFVPAENLVGKAQLVVASWRGGASLLKPWTWVLRFDPGRVLHPLA